MMKSFLNKLKILVKIAIIILILLIIRYVVIFVWFDYSNTWQYNVENFEVYQEDFRAIAEFCVDYCERQNISLSENAMFILASNEDELLYEYQTISMTDEIKASLVNIKGAFSNAQAQLDHINVQDETIYFVTHNGLYSVVYSPNGKPEYLDGKNKGVSKKITDNWYHVVRRQ